MKHLKTLRSRVALWIALLLLAALVLFGIFVYINMWRSLVAAVDESLEPILIQMANEVELRNGDLIVMENPVEDPEFALLRDQGFSMQITDSAGKMVYRYGPFQGLPPPPAELASPDHPGERITIVDAIKGEQIRLRRMALVQGGQVVGIVQVALDLMNVQRTLNLLFVTLLIAVPILVLGAAGGGYFLATRALAPIDKITRTARDLSAQALSARLNLPASEDEVGRLAATFDSMLARLEHAFQRERQFTADASHELRTPLAAMQTILDITLTRQRTVEEYEQALHDLDQETRYMRTLIEALLQLARHDASPQVTKMEAVSLAILLKDVMESLQPIAEDKGLQLLDAIPDQPLTIDGDRDGLIRLFINLISNAIKYTEHGSITVSAATDEEKWLKVTVQDTGVGIPTEHLPRIFDRFYRVDASRSSNGIGLGLSIAQEIAHAHGGEIVAQSEVGKGSRFTVRLPMHG